MRHKYDQRVRLNGRQWGIVEMGLRELLYVAEEGTMRDIANEFGEDPGEIPKAAEIIRIVERIGGGADLHRTISRRKQDAD